MRDIDDPEQKDSAMNDEEDEDAAAPATAPAAAEDSSSGSDFLLSKAEIREKQRRREALKAALHAAASSPAASAVSAASTATAPAPPLPRARLSMPGYVFDAARNRYFKLLPSHIHSAAAGRDADDEDDDDEDAHAAEDMEQRHARPSSHASQQFASLRVTGDPTLHAQDWHTRLSAAATSSAMLHSKKKQRTDVASSHLPLATIPSANSSSSVIVDHNLSRGRNVILGLRAREVGVSHGCNRSFAASAPARRLASHFAPALLRPLPSLLVRPLQSLGSGDSVPMHSVRELSAEQGLAYDGPARLLSVAGKRAIGSADPERSWIATYRLRPAARAPQLDSSGANIVAPPFTLDLLHFRFQPSPVTSLHRFTVPWAQRSEDADIWGGSGSSGEQPTSMLAATLLGSGASPGAFKMWSETDSGQQRQQDESALRVQMDYALREGSCFTSAFSSSHKLVSLGCSKGGQILDVLSSRRLRDLHTSKSDILAQTWMPAALTGGGDSCVLSGTRNGVVQLHDLRVRAASSQPFRLSSSVCYLESTKADPHFIVAAAVDGSIATYDLRRTMEALSIATAAGGGSRPGAAASSPSPARPHSASSSSKGRASSSSAAAAAAASSSSSPLLAPLLSCAGQVNSFDVLRPCIVDAESAALCGLFSGGVDGRVRGWDRNSGSGPLLDLDPLSVVAGFPRRRVGRAVKHVAWLDEWGTLLCGSEEALSALVLHAR